MYFFFILKVTFKNCQKYFTIFYKTHLNPLILKTRTPNMIINAVFYVSRKPPPQEKEMDFVFQHATSPLLLSYRDILKHRGMSLSGMKKVNLVQCCFLRNWVILKGISWTCLPTCFLPYKLTLQIYATKRQCTPHTNINSDYPPNMFLF